MNIQQFEQYVDTNSDACSIYEVKAYAAQVATNATRSTNRRWSHVMIDQQVSKMLLDFLQPEFARLMTLFHGDTGSEAQWRETITEEDSLTALEDKARALVF